MKGTTKLLGNMMKSGAYEQNSAALYNFPSMTRILLSTTEEKSVPGKFLKRPDLRAKEAKVKSCGRRFT